MTLEKNYPYLLIICGFIGILAASLLTLDKIKLLENPGTILPCNINPLISCGPVMASKQAAAFGFPNPILGIIGFAFVFITGVIHKLDNILNKKYWQLFNIGLIFAIIFTHWLIYQSLFNIGALCLYCMVTWGITWPLFFYTILWNIKKVDEEIPLPENKYQNKGLAKIVFKNHLAIAIAWYLIITLAIFIRFRDFFLN